MNGIPLHVLLRVLEALDEAKNLHPRPEPEEVGRLSGKCIYAAQRLRCAIEDLELLAKVTP